MAEDEPSPGSDCGLTGRDTDAAHPRRHGRPPGPCRASSRRRQLDRHRCHIVEAARVVGHPTHRRVGSVGPVKPSILDQVVMTPISYRWERKISWAKWRARGSTPVWSSAIDISTAWSWWLIIPGAKPTSTDPGPGRVGARSVQPITPARTAGRREAGRSPGAVDAGLLDVVAGVVAWSMGVDISGSDPSSSGRKRQRWPAAVRRGSTGGWGPPRGCRWR